MRAMTSAAAQAVLTAFPARQIQLKASASGTPLGNILVALFLGGFACLFLWMLLPNILQAWEVSKAPVLVRDARIANGHCWSKLAIVTCSGNVSYRAADKLYESRVGTTIWGSSHQRVAVVRSAERPELATFDIAIEELTNSILVLLSFVAVFAGPAAYALWKIPQARKAAAIINEGAALNVRPIVVELTWSMGNRSSRDYAFSYSDGSKRHSDTATFILGAKPFMVEDAQPGAKSVAGTKSLGFALAVILPINGGEAMLLDETLTALDFTEDERNRLRAARDSYHPVQAN
jgi:hypothetical protein